MKQILNIVEQMKSSRVQNYVIAGLDSYLLGNGKVRFFKNSRNHQDQITPHSHRFDFTCLVLQGHVHNKIWFECTELEGDYFEESSLIYQDDIGNHKKTRTGRDWRTFKEDCYVQGETYSMKSSEIHSITFSKNAIVLFFEGPEISKASLIIEPVVNGRLIPTYEKRDYMFLTP